MSSIKVLGYSGNLHGYLGAMGAGHDSAAAIVVDGELVAACEEERFNREKHSSRFPQQAVDFCLRQAGLRSVAELDLVTYFWSVPESFRMDIIRQNGPRMAAWSKAATYAALGGAKALNAALGYGDAGTRARFQRFCGGALPADRWRIVPHHQAHVASSFYDSPFEEALCVTLDAVGESSSGMVASCRGTTLEILKDILWPNSLGYLYLFITNYLGFQINSDEYKVMGLAPYGDPTRYERYFNSILTLGEEGGYTVEPNLVVLLMGLLDRSGVWAFPPSMRRGLGPPRHQGEPIDQRHMDIAAALQAALERAVMHVLTHYRRATKLKNLCLAGGVALNSTLNGKIARSGLFEHVWVPTAPHDAGTAVGGALYGYHNILGKPRHQQKLRHRYLGPGFRTDAIEAALGEFSHAILSERPDNVEEHVALALSQGKVVGWYQGRMEWGPRALGNRSILADARRQDMKDIVNHAVKLREGFRPFAPAVLEEHAARWFDLQGLRESPYMMFVVPVWPDKAPRIPAVTHVDGSARVQTVSRDTNPRFHALISAFERLTGVPLVLNTSFNVKGEPIVNTPQDAIRCFLGTRLDLLVLDNVVVQKRAAKVAPHEDAPMTGVGTGRVENGRIMEI